MKAGQLQKPHEPPVPHILLFPPSIKIIGFYGKPAPSQPHLASEPDDLLETHNDRAGVTGNRRLMTGEAARFVYAKWKVYVLVGMFLLNRINAYQMSGVRSGDILVSQNCLLSLFIPLWNTYQ